ncbi:MAG: DWNN domain-containing protein, partial [Monoraphidium minutum]
MSGVVHFKFKSSLVKDSVTFDGHYISVGELKRLIATKKGLGAEGGAELELSDWNTRAVYAVDAEQIPRNTSVIVRRVPAAKARPGPGNRAGAAAGPLAALTALTARAPAAADDFGGDVYDSEAAAKAAREEEDALISQHLDAQAQQWRGETEATVLQDRERAAQRAARGRGHGGRFAGRGPAGFNKPHEGYFCRHCGAHAAHFHEDCPQKDEPKRELRTVRAPAGIPMTLLDRSRNQGNLLLPDGRTGGLRHSKDLFMKEMGMAPTAARRPALAIAD